VNVDITPDMGSIMSFTIAKRRLTNKQLGCFFAARAVALLWYIVGAATLPHFPAWYSATATRGCSLIGWVSCLAKTKHCADPS
jgi:hypothetical protein